MSIKSFKNSIAQIFYNKNISIIAGLWKYFSWQIIKNFWKYPFSIKVSDSIFELPNKNIANQGGTKLYTQGVYDYNNINLIKMLLNNDCSIIFDIGANFGVYSILLSEKPSAKIYAFEPHPYTFNLLKRNIKLNGRENIYPHNIAISNSNSKVKFSNFPGSSTNSIIENNSKNYIVIHSTSIKNFTVSNNVVPEIVKIDVEGHEYACLLGFENKISEVKMFFIEIEQGNLARVTAYMSDNNFIGPLYYSFSHNIFSIKKMEDNYSEDYIFVNKAYVGKLKTALRSNFVIDE